MEVYSVSAVSNGCHADRAVRTSCNETSDGGCVLCVGVSADDRVCVVRM
jgi:hypothetical protein